MKRLIPLILVVILILPACTTQEGGENVANYLYNGVELPDINTVWTDKETYPYAIISTVDETSDYKWFLVLTSKEMVSYFGDFDAQWIVNQTGETIIYYLYGCAESLSGWEYIGSSSLATGGGWSRKTPMYANYDVKDKEGNVFLAASEPVPVGNDHVKHLSGDGMALYNGVMLPNIDNLGSLFESVGGNKETYQYSVITHADGASLGVSDGNLWFAWFDTARFSAADGVISPPYSLTGDAWFSFVLVDTQELVNDLAGMGITPVLGEWSIFMYGNTTTEVTGSPIWTNTDILNTDGSTYLSASDPIPLDGMDVITWDGSVDGLLSVELMEGISIVKVSDYPLDLSQLSSGVLGLLSLQNNFHSGIRVSDLLNDGYSFESDADLGYIFLGLSNIYSFFVGSFSLPSFIGSFGGEVGTYFLANDNGLLRTTLFAYPASSGDLDFSNTELSIFDPNVTANSADFAVDWTGLPVTTSNHVHYFLSGELDDGTQAANSPVYLFSSDVAADGEHEIIFQDLEPNTEYTVTAKLLYNTTGDRSDFTDSGVKATFDFTTLADGGFDRNSFLLGLASGLGKTAAMKADADHNAWAQGYVVGKALWKML